MARRSRSDTELPPALLDAIATQADGVPLFIEELTKAVLETRTAIRTARCRRIGVPDDAAGSLLARLDRLPAAKQVAQIGAVIGREFSHELISDGRRSAGAGVLGWA